MYLNDKSHRFTFRVNDVQFNFIISVCDKLKIAPSDFFRMMLDCCISSAPADIYNLEVLRRENEQTDFNDQL